MLAFDPEDRIKMTDILKDPFLQEVSTMITIPKYHETHLKDFLSQNVFLCDFLDPISREKRMVEINYFSIIGKSNYTIYLGLLKDDQNKLISEVAIKQMVIEKNEINKETEIMKKVNHENIVTLYHSYKPDSQNRLTMLSLIMEYCEGLDLSRYLEKSQQLPEWQIR